MPNPIRLKLDERLVTIHATDARYAHTYWSFPEDHPIRQHRGPGIVVLANPAKRKAYVLAARTQDVHRASVALISRLRHYLRDLNGDAHHLAPEPDKKLPRYTSLDLPHWLAVDWGADRSTAFTWLLADPFPPLYWREFGSDKEGKARYKAEVTARRGGVVRALERQGWELYNPPTVRGLAAPGARMALLDQRDAFRASIEETNRNHLNWLDMLAEGSIGLDPKHNPLDPDVQRAFARYQHGMGHPLPKPGGPMRGHRSSDNYKFQLPEGELTLRCPPDCPKRGPQQVDNALEDRDAQES